MWMNILFVVISVVTMAVVLLLVGKAEESNMMARAANYSTDDGAFAVLYAIIAIIAIAVVSILWLSWFDF